MGASPLQIETYELRAGNALDLLRALPDECVQSVVTSPPYYALRAYGTDPQVFGGDRECAHEWGSEIPGDARGGSGPNTKSTKDEDDKSVYGRDAARGAFCQKCSAWLGELGLEPTPAMFVEHMVEICREVRRVLRKDGTFFLNIADTYNSAASNKQGTHGGVARPKYKDHGMSGMGRRKTVAGAKVKDLLGIPWQLALALRDDGWWLRQDAIWSKAGGNCPRCYFRIEKGSGMPEPVKDRFVRSHEYVFLLAKHKRYYFDAEAVKTKHSTARRRDVFHISSQAFRGAHYATMPEALAEVCVKGGTSEHGACAKCNAPYKRLTKKGKANRKAQKAAGGNDDGEYHGQNTKDYEAHKAQAASDVKRRILAGMKKIETLGWEPSCKCKDAGDPVPCIVLDPFSGAATTGAVALKTGRRYIGLELLPSNNTEIAKPRLEAVLEALKAPDKIDYLPITSDVYLGAAEILLHRVQPESVRLILTDPPYNVSRENNYNTMGREGINFEWDGGFDQETWVRLADKALMVGGSIVIWNDWKVLGLISHLLLDMGYDVKRNLTWVKSNPWAPNPESNPAQRTEIGLWAVKRVKKTTKWVHNLRPHRTYEDVVFHYGVPKGSKKKEALGRYRHETKKPDSMFREIIQIFSNPGDLILDPFAGGGTTSFAAAAEGRRCISFELMEKWFKEAKLHAAEGKNAKPLKFPTTPVEKAKAAWKEFRKRCKSLGVDPLTLALVEQLDASVAESADHQEVSDAPTTKLVPAPSQVYKHVVKLKGL